MGKVKSRLTSEEKTKYRLIGGSMVGVGLLFGYGMTNGVVVASVPGLILVIWGSRLFGKTMSHYENDQQPSNETQKTQVSPTTIIFGAILVGVIVLAVWYYMQANS